MGRLLRKSIKSYHPYQLDTLVGRSNSRIIKMIIKSDGREAATAVFWEID